MYAKYKIIIKISSSRIVPISDKHKRKSEISARLQLPLKSIKNELFLSSKKMEKSVLSVVAEMMRTSETDTEKMKRLETKLNKVADRYIRDYEQWQKNKSHKTADHDFS